MLQTTRFFTEFMLLHGRNIVEHAVSSVFFYDFVFFSKIITHCKKMFYLLYCRNLILKNALGIVGARSVP